MPAGRKLRGRNGSYCDKNDDDRNVTETTGDACRQLITRRAAIIDDAEIKEGFDGDRRSTASQLAGACRDSDHLSARVNVGYDQLLQRQRQHTQQCNLKLSHLSRQPDAQA